MVMAAQTVRWGRAPTPSCAIDDAWNRLVEVYTYAGGPPTTFGKYRYDGLHRRIWRIVDGFAPPNRTDYYYNTSWQVLEERFYDGEDPETTVATDVTCQYVWDPRYIDAPVCRDEDGNSDDDCTDTDWDTGDDPDEHLYYCQDANFNTTALVERSDGSVVERYVYDPYGKVTIYDDDWSDTVTWGDSKKNEVLYCGYRYDHESRLYHVRNRSYHPTLGRWMQRDPIGYGAGLTLYGYVHQQPTLLTDPSGAAEIRLHTPSSPLAFPYRQLKWSDFMLEGHVADGAAYLAHDIIYSGYGVEALPEYECKRVSVSKCAARGGRTPDICHECYARVKPVPVFTAVFYPEVSKQDHEVKFATEAHKADLLRHEQGHFRLAEARARSYNNMMRTKVANQDVPGWACVKKKAQEAAKSNARDWMENILDEFHKYWRAEQGAYDDVTDHGLLDAQKAFDALLGDSSFPVLPKDKKVAEDFVLKRAERRTLLN